MSKQNYIKYPVKISTILPKVFNKLRKKNGGELLEIKLNWEKIVEKDIANSCFASKYKRINNKNVLVIVCDQRNILEISYSSEKIKDQINSFFKSNVIDEIKFKKILQY